MMTMIRRHQRSLALALLLLNLTGARAIAVTDACEHSRVFFSAGLGFKAIAKAVAHQQWKRSSSETAFGEGSMRYSARDLETNQMENRVVLVPVRPAVSVALEIKAPRAGPLTGWVLPSDENPVQPRHLQI